MRTGLAAETTSGAPRRTAGARRRGRAPAWAPVAALFAAAAALYIVLALRTPLPVLFPDELRYSHLARSVADGHGFTWRGEHVGQSAALYVYFIAPLWALLSSTVDAYHASKVAGTLALCTQVVPVWLLGRELAGQRSGLLAAALSVAGTWMLMAAGVVTEVLAMPLSTAALCTAVLALRRPGSRLWIVALAFALLATWARIQMAVLIPALLAAFALDVLRRPDRRAPRLRAHRPALLVFGVLAAAGLALALAKPSLSGDYAAVLDLRPSLGTIARKTALQLAELVALSGFAPVLLAAGAACSGPAWRDDRTGPLLAVFWPAALAFALLSGFFLAGFPPAPWGIQRYVAYAVPLALVLLVVLAGDRRLLLRPVVLAVAGLGAVLLLGRPAIAMMGEERAAWATTFRVHQVLGLDAGAALALVALAVLAGVALIARRARGPASAATGAAALLLVILAVQDQAAWHQMTTTAASFRTQLPGDLEWIDHGARGPAALLSLTQNAPQYEDLEIFNRDIAAAYVPPAGLPGRPLQGRRCTYRFEPSGALRVEPGCGPVPRRFVLPDPAAAITFHDEVRSVADPRIGRIAELAPGVRPRAQSVLILACPRPSPVYSSTSPKIIGAGAPKACNPAVSGTLWLDAPAEVAVRYRGGRDAHTVTVGGRRHTVAPGASRTIRFRAPAGMSRFTLEQDWTSTDGAPRLEAAALVRGARTTPIL